jgi:transcription initiation factor TFIID subunit 3
MKKHSKSEDDSKWAGTLLGRPHEQGEVLIEGGPASSIAEWNAKLLRAAEKPSNATEGRFENGGEGAGEDGSVAMVDSPGTSILSSLGDAEMGEDGSL